MFLKVRELNLYERYILEVKERCWIEKYDEDNLFTLEKGLRGEEYFYYMFKDCAGGAKIWDLRLKHKGRNQYDFIIVSKGRIVHFDTKYYEGHYNYVNGIFKSKSDYVISNPLFKLETQHARLKLLVDKLGLDYEVKSYVVFVGEQFQVTGYNGDDRILFDQDLKKIFKSLNTVEVTSEDIQVARMLMEYHDDSDEYQRIFYYEFEEMKKGVKCPKCRNFLPSNRNRLKKVKCQCGCEITKKEIVKLAFDAIYLLKNRGVTVGDIAMFSGIGRTTIKEVLKNKCQRIGIQRGSKYIPDNKDAFIIKEDEAFYLCDE
ncbi:nuclease-related domain-containing protein [Macrococcus equi]|uniref:nuclease-related domain-containing protein n=1 Tax=Macrococcus equi TaxID=3395462 RepID=UPI0039BDD4A1